MGEKTSNEQFMSLIPISTSPGLRRKPIFRCTRVRKVSSSAKSVLKWPAPIRLGAKVIYTTQSQLQIQGYLTWLELKKIKMIVVFVLNVAILKHNYKFGSTSHVITTEDIAFLGLGSWVA